MLHCGTRIHSDQIQTFRREAFSDHAITMSALVIKSFPDALHARLRQAAAAHRRSVIQQTNHLLEKALASEDLVDAAPPQGASNWANRKLLPDYEAALKAGACSDGSDSSVMVSEERDTR